MAVISPTSQRTAEALGISRQAFYNWRQKPGNPGRTSKGFDVIAWRQFIDSQKQVSPEGAEAADLKLRRLRAATLEAESKAIDLAGKSTPTKRCRRLFDLVRKEIQKKILTFDISQKDKERLIGAVASTTFDLLMERYDQDHNE